MGISISLKTLGNKYDKHPKRTKWQYSINICTSVYFSYYYISYIECLQYLVIAHRYSSIQQVFLILKQNSTVIYQLCSTSWILEYMWHAMDPEEKWKEWLLMILNEHTDMMRHFSWNWCSPAPAVLESIISVCSFRIIRRASISRKWRNCKMPSSKKGSHVEKVTQDAIKGRLTWRMDDHGCS